MPSDSAVQHRPPGLPSLLLEHLHLCTCPACGEALLAHPARACLTCRGCERIFTSEEQIPRLFHVPDRFNGIVRPPSDVTAVMKAFYEETPFPGYEDTDSGSSLREKAEKGVFARLLDAQLPEQACVLEAGCGTGQLSNFLAMTWGRTVFGADMCLNSLRLGQKFKDENQNHNVCFVQMNLFRPVFRPSSFDLVVSNGVLHHTSDPFAAFKSIAALVKPGGHIVIGLYNRYGRMGTDVRRVLFRVTGRAFHWLDPRLRDRRIGEAKLDTWFKDQYRNPHESKHTIGQVLGWFDRTGFEFVNGIPKPSAESLSPDERLFEKSAPGSALEHFVVQLGMLISGSKEGGLFVLIGRKRA